MGDGRWEVIICKLLSCPFCSLCIWLDFSKVDGEWVCVLGRLVESKIVSFIGQGGLVKGVREFCFVCVFNLAGDRKVVILFH